MLNEYKDMKFTVGSLIRLDCGDYSDYAVLGFFVVIKEFYPVEEIEKYLEKYPKQKKDYDFNNDKFIYYLITSGFLLEVRHEVFFLGGCNKISEARIELLNGPIELELNDLNTCDNGHEWYGNDLEETCPDCKE